MTAVFKCISVILLFVQLHKTLLDKASIFICNSITEIHLKTAVIPAA